MKNIIKSILVFGVLFAVVVGIFGLMTGGFGGGHNSNLDTSDLEQREKSEVNRYLSRLQTGWNDTVYLNVKAYINHPDRNNSYQLGNYFVSKAFNIVDSIIGAEYMCNSRAVSTFRHSKLGPAYRGVDSLVAFSPSLTSTDIYRNLQNERRAFNDAVAFANNSFVMQTKFNLRLVSTSDGYNFDWSETLANYTAYRDQMNNRRLDIQRRLSELPRLSNITWTNTALSQNTLNQKIGQGKRTYINNEINQVVRFLNQLPSDTRLVDDEIRDQVGSRLNLVETNLPRELRTTNVTQAFVNARRALFTPTEIF